MAAASHFPKDLLTSSLQALAELQSSALLLSIAAVALLMPIAVHVGERAGARRSVVRTVIIAITVILFILYITGTFAVFSQVKALVAAKDTSLRSAAGIAKFCRDLRALAEAQALPVLLLITVVYMLLQTFCIPGTVVLNAAVGAILGVLLGAPICTVLGTAGACSCFLLSKAVGTSLVEAADARLMASRGLPKIRAQVQKYRQELLVYLLFLRLTPILPNWLINLASPVVGVPLRTFALATFIGIIPQTCLSVRFGSVARVSKSSDGSNSRIITPWDTLLLAIVAIALLVGLHLKKKFAATPSRRDEHAEGHARPHDLTL